MGSDDRRAVLDLLCTEIGRRVVGHTLRVCVDGPDAAGKTTLADELAVRLERVRLERGLLEQGLEQGRLEQGRLEQGRLEQGRLEQGRLEQGRPEQGRPVIRLSVDRFHRPAAVRRRRGSLSPQGYYADSFDNETIVEHVLKPLGPGGDGRYLTAAFDHRSDAPAPEVWAQAPENAVLLFDGVFMLRPELRDFWDMTIHLHVDPEESLARARIRDVELFGSVEVVEERYRRRYLPGQELYRAEADPLATADIVLDMNDPARPHTMGRG